MVTSCYSQYDTHVLLNCDAQYPVLLGCDHASSHIPQELHNLGVTEEQLTEHIAWDIGAGAVAAELGQLLNVPVVLGAHSRLVVDCNRNLDDPTAFPVESDGVNVPGNQSIATEEREARANAFYWPYHHAVRDALRNLEQLVAAPALLAIHSFTPQMNGSLRPWHLGALWDKDDRMALPFIRHFRETTNVVVGDNEPYSGRHPADFTLDHHAEAEGLPHLGIEIRQDLIDSDTGAKYWAAILANALKPILEDNTLFTHRAGSRS
ncbi:MAG: N-formylglutamate amidohydrolase [Gammaproteobacteria bacterium]|nr:N-formylglutamate amidohydrolase [Gammaproteobacteria bacterium]MCP4088856.1 N-formylglutamate amidohydrolase [Gammaproteobacteria bacterium]